MIKITETSSHYDNLEQMSTTELLTSINQEDHMIADAVEKAIPQVEALVIDRNNITYK